MLQAFGLSYEPSPLVGKLFENLDLSLAEGEKVALVGRNGCGKTKLIQILASKLKPQAGHLVLPRGASVGYFPQDIEFSFSGTSEEFLCDGIDAEFIHSAVKGAHKLGMDDAMLKRPFPSLSIGEQVRATFARLLCTEPSVLLLDEPTNHLDIDGRLWLEEFLNRCPQAVLMVCHDRTVVNAVVSRVYELENGVLHSWTGGYDDMLVQKREHQEGQFQLWQKQSAEERRLKNLAERARQAAAKVAKKPRGNNYNPYAKPFYEAKAAKVAKRVQATFKRIEAALPDRVDKPHVADDLRLVFPNCPPLRSDPAISVRELFKSYGPRELYGGLSLDIRPGKCTALIGANGSGKTTLFRLLEGRELPDRGGIRTAPDVRIAHLTQQRAALSSDLLILDALELGTQEEEFFARTLLARLGIRADAVEKKVGCLSVGERTKVELVNVMLQSANVLILDEPTNHLEVEAVEVLEEALAAYPGAVLFASHDRAFVANVADQTVELCATSPSAQP